MCLEVSGNVTVATRSTDMSTDIIHEPRGANGGRGFEKWQSDRTAGINNLRTIGRV